MMLVMHEVRELYGVRLIQWVPWSQVYVNSCCRCASLQIYVDTRTTVLYWRLLIEINEVFHVIYKRYKVMVQGGLETIDELIQEFTFRENCAFKEECVQVSLPNINVLCECQSTGLTRHHPLLLVHCE